MIAAADKIIKFSTLEQLEEAIVQDLNSHELNAQRYGVRFIMLNDFATFRELTKFLVKDLKVKLYEIQRLALGDDLTITIDMLSDAIKGLTESSLVTPFSELVRFYKEEEFNGFFNEIILAEDLKRPGKRIYIPVIGLHNRFIDFLKNFGRIEESAPIWQLYSLQDDKVKVFISKFNVPNTPDSAEFCQLDTMKDWLEFWKKQAPREKIICSARPIRTGWKNSRSDSIFSFAEITNAYEYISDFLGIHIPFAYDANEEHFWAKILDVISKETKGYFSWRASVEKYFNTWGFGFKQILDIWGDESRSDFDRWLLKNYLLHTEVLADKSYTKVCLENTTDYTVPQALLVMLAQYIFYAASHAEREKYADERRSLMTQERDLFRKYVPQDGQDWVKEQIIILAQDDATFGIAKSLCTGTFDFERELYFDWFVLRSDRDFGVNHLKEYYSDLYNYLWAADTSFYRPGAEWLADYFAAYRQAKVKDEYPEEIQIFIATYNANEEKFWDWYFKHQTCHDLYYELMADDATKPDKVYWIDGLGAEFIPFILNVINLEKTNYEVVNAEIATTGLPSNTSLNRFDVDNETHFKFGGLDTLAHGSHYEKQKTLIKELEELKKIIKDILKNNSVGTHNISIVSDHGLSALSRMCDATKLTGKAHHEGRYIPYDTDEVAESMPEYISVTNEDDKQKYKVALTHSSFGKRPSHEVHGGCTPEEVLVPFIVISNNPASKPINYKINVKTPEIPVSAALFECIIIPQPKSAELIVGKQKIKMDVKGTTWSALIPNPVEGNITVCVLPNKGRAESFDIKIFGLGMSSIIDDFDI